MSDSIENYDIYNLVGRGGFAKVYRARCRASGEEVAIKMIDKAVIVEKRMEKRVQQEVEIHSKLVNPHILKVMSFFEDESKVYLVLEFCENGELNRFLQKRGYPFNESEAKLLIQQIVRGMLYLQKHNILHRDLSLGNMLLTASKEVKIADFGLAAQLGHVDEKHFTMCGTPNFISPEIVSQRAHDLKADVWSLGCMIYTLLVGHAPFDTNEINSTLRRVKNGDFEIPNHVSPLGRDLIRSLLRKNPNDRLPLDRVLTHPFLSDSAFGRDRGHAHSLEDDEVFGGVRSLPPAKAREQTLGSDGSSGRGSQDSKQFGSRQRASPTSLFSQRPSPPTSNFGGIQSRVRIRSRDPSPPVRMRSRPEELRGVETSMDRLKSEALRLQPCGNSKPPPGVNLLEDLKCSIVLDSASNAANVSRSFRPDNAVKRTFNNRITSFEEIDKENESSSSSDRKRRLLPSSSSSLNPLPSSGDSLSHVPSLKNSQSECSSSGSPREPPKVKEADGEAKKTARSGKPSAPLQTLRLRPYRQRHNRSVMSILDDGRVCIELLKEDRVKEVLTVSSDGNVVTLFRPNGGKGVALHDTPLTKPPEGDNVQVYQFNELPQKLIGKYNLASDFVQLNRTITPKVTLFGAEAKCMVMESGNPADYQIAFYDGCQIVARAKSGIKFIDSDGTSTAFPAPSAANSGNTDATVWKHLSPQNREKWNVAQECLKKCHQLESALSGIESMWTASGAAPCIFPVVFGRQPHSASASSKPESLPAASSPSSSAPSTSSRPSPRLQISPSSMPPVPTSIFSNCDASILSVASKAKEKTSVLKSVQTSSHASINAVCRFDAGGRDFGTEEVRLLGVGRAVALPSGAFFVDFDDGTRLGVEAAKEVSSRGGDRKRLEFVDRTGRTRLYDAGTELPADVADKVKHLPTVLDRFAGLGIR